MICRINVIIDELTDSKVNLGSVFDTVSKSVSEPIKKHSLKILLVL